MRIYYKFIGPSNSSSRPFSVTSFSRSPSGLLRLRIDEGSWYLLEDSHNLYVSSHGHLFTVLEESNGIPTKVTFTSSVLNQNLYIKIDSLNLPGEDNDVVTA